MKLSVNNIEFVKENVCDGITYGWFVSMKSYRVSDCRYYVNYNEQGRTCVAEYSVADLPKTVQNFINSHERIKLGGGIRGEHEYITFEYSA